MAQVRRASCPWKSRCCACGHGTAQALLVLKELALRFETGPHRADMRNDLFAPHLECLHGCQGAVGLDLEHSAWLQRMRHAVSGEEHTRHSKHGTETQGQEWQGEKEKRLVARPPARHMAQTQHALYALSQHVPKCMVLFVECDCRSIGDDGVFADLDALLLWPEDEERKAIRLVGHGGGKAHLFSRVLFLKGCTAERGVADNVSAFLSQMTACA